MQGRGRAGRRQQRRAVPSAVRPTLSSPPGLCPFGIWPSGRGLEVKVGRRVVAPTFQTFQWEGAALKVDYANSSGGRKRGSSSPSRRSSKKTSNEDDEGDSRSSDSLASCFGFVAYSVNNGEKSWVKVKSLSHQPTCSSTSPSEPSGSPAPSPSPRKLRCLNQRDTESEERHEHSSRKRRSKEGNRSTFDSLRLR